HPCVNSTGNVYTTVPGMQNYQWTVSPGGTITAGGTPTSNTVTVTWTTSGPQTVSVNYTNPGGCNSPNATVLNVNVQPGPVPVIYGPASVCLNSAGNIYSTQPGMSNYSWSVTPGGTITSGVTYSSNSVTVTWDSTGVQSVSVNYSDSSGCNGTPAIFNVFVDSLPIPGLSGPVIACVNSVWNNYTTESGMTNYHWIVSSGGTIVAGGSSSDNSVSVIWNISGNQSVSVTYINSLGCMAQPATNLGVTVDTYPGAAGNILGLSPVCAATQNLQYSVQPITNASSYFWTFPMGFNIVSGNGTNAVIVDVQMSATQGTIKVYGSNDCGNGTPSPPFPVAVNMPPVANAGPDQDICPGIPFTITQANAANYSSIEWFSNGSGSLQGNSTLTPVYTTGPSDSATVVLTMIVNGNSPCTNDTSTVNLLVKTKASVNAGQDVSSCGMLPVDLALSHANNYTSLQWSTSGSGTFSDPSALHPNYYPGISDISNGTVVLTLTGYSNLPCPSDSDQLVVNLKKPVSVFAGHDTTVCDGRKLYINKADAENYSSLEWKTTGDGHFSDPYSLNSLYFPGPGDKNSGGTMLLFTAGGNPPCVAADDTLKLTFSPAPAVMAGPDGNICIGQTYTVNGATASNSAGLHWTLEGSGTLENGTTLSPTAIALIGESSLTLTLFTQGLSTCSDSIVSDQMWIHIYPPPTATAVQEFSIKYDSTANLTCLGADGSGIYIFKWVPESLLVDPTIRNPETVNLTNDTIFIVTVTDSLTGCSASDHVLVKVGLKEGPDDCIVIHNVITPNGDGVNDQWIIDCLELFPENNVTLLDRWGDVVNTFHNYNNNDIVWDGKNSLGEALPEGTYFYILQIKSGPTFKGWIYLR
ncbi:MAG: gliding motility-associated C-terminal domain-containing protein, partial [Bacteroidota bacterium]